MKETTPFIFIFYIFLYFDIFCRIKTSFEEATTFKRSRRRFQALMKVKPPVNAIDYDRMLIEKTQSKNNHHGCE